MTLRATCNQRPATLWQTVAGCGLLVAALGMAGCVRRSLTIRTDPPGALVYVNDQLKGPSPVTYDFLWYGWHRVILRKDGFERLEDRRLIKAPIYLWIPFDFAMEFLPLPIRDVRVWSYELHPTVMLPVPVPPNIASPILTLPPPPAPAEDQGEGTDEPSHDAR
jgi:hypothetical protein